ncbi:hypothetical protein ACFQRB_13920 [Halobaculum litoreum]|uniref:Uncharacterized protein n=1 Tax=Halobaculum litoreum TaxID=3031998 RepID=A0ABD5XTP5_9EURY
MLQNSFLAAVVVEVCGHERAGPRRRREVRGRRVDERRQPAVAAGPVAEGRRVRPRRTLRRREQAARRLPPADGDVAVGHRDPAGVRLRVGDADRLGDLAEVAPFVAEQPVRTALDADEQVHPVAHDRAGVQRARAVLQVESDGPDHVRQLPVVAQLVEARREAVAGDEHAVAPGAVAVQRGDRPARPEVPPAGVDAEAEQVAPADVRVVRAHVDRVEEQVGVAGVPLVGVGVVDVDLLGAVGVEVGGDDADGVAPLVGDRGRRHVAQGAVAPRQQAVGRSVPRDEHTGTAHAGRDGRPVAAVGRVVGEVG